MDFGFDEGYRIRSGRVVVSFLPPDASEMDAVPLAGPDDCHCAIKVRLGIAEVELSERWVRAQVYEEEVTRVAEILAEEKRNAPARNDLIDLELQLRDGALTVLVNGAKALSTPRFPADLGSVHLSTYRHTFHISAFSVEAHLRDTLAVNTDSGFVDVAARFRPSRFNKGGGMKNHHLVVWDGGKSSMDAVFSTYASDSAVHQALVQVGAKPGNNLTQAVWSERNNARSTAPDRRVAGSRIRMEIVHGGKVLKPADILRDVNKKSLDLRFGGNLALIPQWRSGCVVCLESCPGGKIGNRTYTIRDQVKGIPSFALRTTTDLLSEDEVTLRFRVVK
jgi:hypothetical protein